MKQTHFPAFLSLLILRWAICALFIGSANQSVDAREKNPPKQSTAPTAAEGGRLIIRRSPVLGGNVAISLRIDGRRAGTLVQGQTYDKSITPGRHTLTADPNTGGGWRGTLEVRPGETYSYTVSYSVSRLVLTPVSRSR